VNVPFDLFVSSPDDLREERKAVAEIVGQLSQKPHLRRRCSIRAHLYEEVVPPVLAESAQAAVMTFMMDPARCDVLVCLLGGRLGTPMKDPYTGEWFPSGTIYELVRAYESTKRPKPEILLYVSGPRPHYDQEKRREVELFLSDFERGQTRVQGIRPAPFEDAEHLRRRMLDDLDAVFDRLLGLHAARRFRQRTAAVAVGCLAALIGYVVAEIGEVRPLKISAGGESARQARAKAEAVLLAATEGNGPWASVQRMPKELGCPAAGPLLEALGRLEIQADLAMHSMKILEALGELSKRSAGHCGCDELLSVLKVESQTTKYSRATHRRVLEVLRDSSCESKEEVVCDYLHRIGTPAFSSALCSGEGKMCNLEDLKGAAREVLKTPCST